MSDVFKDRVKETTTTTGTGTLTLAGAVSQYQAFSVIGNGNTCRYTLVDANGTDWEIGVGTWATGNTLARTTCLTSSAGGTTKITLSAGTHTVFLSPDSTCLAFLENPATFADVITLSNLTASNWVFTDASKNLVSKTDAQASALIGAVGIQLGENASLALDPAGSADGKYSGITIAGTAGEALAFGDVIVLDVTAGQWFKGSVSAAAAADGDLRGGTGMCVLAAAGAASATTVLLMGTCRADANFPALTVGSVVYATTAGDITVTQPSTTDHIIKVLGFALTADEIMFNPSMDYITHT
jgi:hypothetical protein